MGFVSSLNRFWQNKVPERTYMVLPCASLLPSVEGAQFAFVEAFVSTGCRIRGIPSRPHFQPCLQLCDSWKSAGICRREEKWKLERCTEIRGQPSSISIFPLMKRNWHFQTILLWPVLDGAFKINCLRNVFFPLASEISPDADTYTAAVQVWTTETQLGAEGQRLLVLQTELLPLLSILT